METEIRDLTKVLTDYNAYHHELQSELEKTSEGFVRIGYLLKIARDTAILSDSQYSNYLEFAQGEFGLDKSMVSRFIRINDKFSEGGDSDRLLEQYKGFGYAKLSLMLTIPEAVAEELTPDYTKSEIQEIKAEIEEEQSKTDLEVFEENMEAVMNPPTDSVTVQTIRQLGEENPELYVKIWKGFEEADSCENIKNIFKPLPQMTYICRVPGKGKVVVMAKEEGVSITIARTEEKIQASWMDIYSAWSEIVLVCTEDGDTIASGKQSWQQAYGKDYPEPEVTVSKNDEVAPVQPKKQSKVVAPKKEEKKKTPKVEKKEPEKAEEGNDTPIESLCEEEAVSDPENETAEMVENAENTSEESENAENTQCEEIDNNTIRGWKAGLTMSIKVVDRLIGEGNYKGARSKLEGMISTLNRIIDAEEVQ